MGHVQYMAAVAGLPETSVYDLESRVGWDAKRRVALPFARKLTRTPEKVERADIDALRQEFTDEEIVQLVFAICHFNTMNRLADAFGVPLEEGNVFATKWESKEKPAEAPKDAGSEAAKEAAAPPTPAPGPPESEPASKP